MLVVVAAGACSVLAVPSAQASCAATSEATQFAQADIVFEGVAQPGNSNQGTLLSPATFEVERYLKGAGPTQVEVTTATSDAGDGIYLEISTGIHPSAGERWRIFATGRADGVLDTSTCHGSHRLGASTMTEVADQSSAAHTDLDLARSDTQGSSPWPPLALTAVVLTLGMAGGHVLRLTDQSGSQDSR